MKITKKKILKNYHFLLNSAEKNLNQKNYQKVEVLLQSAAKLMYNFNIFYTDEKYENLLKKMGQNLLPQNNLIEKENRDQKKILFYDSFLLNRGLAYQYLKALIANNYQILYIGEHQENLESLDYYHLLKKDNNSEIYLLKETKFVAEVKELNDKINNFKPDQALVYISPWDIVAMTTFSQMSYVEKFLINLTDHAFWPGQCAADYFLEFRSYGYNVSRKFRNISENKLLLSPFYPKQSPEVFTGFDFPTKNKKIIFSGGSAYKIYGSNLFFKTIKYILNKDENTIFVFASSGQTKYFADFIEREKLQNRVYLIKERKDLNEVIKRSYFYLNTYPITGGLMSQFAAINGKIPVSFVDKKNKCEYVESFFVQKNSNLKTYTNEKEYFSYIEKLLNNKELVNTAAKELPQTVISEKDFCQNIKNLLEGQKSNFEFEKDDDLDSEYFSEIFLNSANNYLKSYYGLFIHFKKFYLYKNFWGIQFFKEMFDKLVKIKFKK